MKVPPKTSWHRMPYWARKSCLGPLFNKESTKIEQRVVKKEKGGPQGLQGQKVPQETSKRQKSLMRALQTERQH